MTFQGLCTVVFFALASGQADAADLQEHAAIAPNAEVTFVVTGVQPGTRVRFLASQTPGPGACPAPLQGECLDLVAPVITLGDATATSRGHAVLTKQFGPNVPSATIFTQAVGVDAGVAFTTNVQQDGTSVCSCPAIWQPVCGEDGQTYSNECQAQCSSVDVVSDGECESCFCPEIWLPVCGIDGETYGNVCEADCAQVEVVSEGVCEDCVCPDVWLPVCGIDGQIYGNACEAGCANVAIGPVTGCP
jgi:hypothetical protein